MDKVRRLILTALTGTIGLLLVLAGQGLIQLSLKLELYLGIALLVVAIFAYIPHKRGAEKITPEDKEGGVK